MISPSDEKGTVTGLLFSNKNYSVVLTYDTGTTQSNTDNAARIYNKYETGFVTYQTRNTSCYYIAIGY